MVLSTGILISSASMRLPGTWKKARSITPCSCLMLPGQLQPVSIFSASGLRCFCGMLYWALISARIWLASTEMSFTRSRSGGMRMTVSSTISNSWRLNSPLSARRFRLLSQAAITRIFSFFRSRDPGMGKPFRKTSASRSPKLTGSFSTSSINRVPPMASSNFPAVGGLSPSGLPKNSSSIALGDSSVHFTTIRGAAARALA